MKTKNKTEKLAIMQIILLVIGTIAIGYILGSGFKVVSAQDGGECVLADGGVWKFIIGSGIYICEAGTCLKGQQKTSAQMNINERGSCAQIINLLNSQISGTYLPSTQQQTPSNIQSPVQGGGVVTTAIAGAGTTEAMKFISSKIPYLGSQKVTAVSKVTASPKTGTAVKEITQESFAKRATGWLWGGEMSYGAILINAAFATAIYAWSPQLIEQLGVSPELAVAIGRGAGVTYGLQFSAFPLLGKIKALSFLTGGWGTIIALGIGFIVGLANYKNTKVRIVQFNCYPWQPPKGGEDCEQCNNNELGCSEYQCKSLGASCQIVNQGTEDQMCTWVNRNDIIPPVIQPWEDALSTDYKYAPDNTISPPDKGVKIVKAGTNGCVDAYFPLEFGITLDEPGKCKIETSRKNSFEEMVGFFSNSPIYKDNHSQKISLPSPATLATQNITLVNGNSMSLFVRCEDTNGNSNTAEFVFNFCVNEGPDTTAPLIVNTDIINNMPIANGQTTLTTGVYINEPAECRWSKLDKDYEDMENLMECSTDVLSMNALGLYRCIATLTGLKDKVDNEFYFRCKDQPELKGVDESKRYKNSESYKYTLIGTMPLVINELKPNETIRDSTDLIKVTLEAETSAGYNEGESICSFSSTGNAGSYVEFYNTGTHEHSQDLYLSEGSYAYQIRCVDLGGNADTGTVSFKVETDVDFPTIVRVYSEDNYLKIITNENSECVYSNVDCNYLFDDGIEMTTLDDVEHFADWDLTHNFYIKCRDEFGNEPLPNACGLIARPFEIDGK